MSDQTAQLIGLRGVRGRLTATACAELVAIDLLRVADGALIDGGVVHRHIAALRHRDDLDERLAVAAKRAQPMHVLKVVQAWSGALAKTRRMGLA